MPQRELHFKCVFDDNIITVTDGGRGKIAGTDTTSRHQARHIVNKRTVIDGKDYPVFLLDRSPATLSPNDDFDRKELQDVKGNWNLAYPEWERIRERNISQRSDRQAAAQAEANRRMARDVVEGISKIAGATRDTAARIDPDRAATVAGDAAFESALKEGKSRNDAQKIARVAAEDARKRAVAAKNGEPLPPSAPDDRDAKIAALEKKLANLEKAAAGGADKKKAEDDKPPEEKKGGGDG